MSVWDSGVNLTMQDRSIMMTYGRYTARDGDKVAQSNAAENLAIVGVDSKEGASLRFWFHEGVRNYAADQFHVDTIMEDTIAAAKALEEDSAAPALGAR